MKNDFFTLLGMAGLAAAVALVWYAVEHGYSFETDYTCVRCRAVRHVTSFFGSQPVSVVGADATGWFAEHVPAHAHEWGWSGRTVTRRLWGWNALACGARHPVWSVTPEQQAKFMQRASAEQIKSFYADLGSPDLAVRKRCLQMVYESARKARP